MNLESQVVSLPLAKRLKELGVKQESLWFHVAPNWYVKPLGDGPQSYIEKLKEKGEAFAAFTVAELGEMLPAEWASYRSPRRYWHGERPMYGVKGVHGWGDIDGIHEKTESDARAKMLIYLIEKGMVKP